MAVIDETHDPTLRSWVDSANRHDCDFPIQNLPLGVFRLKGESHPRVGCAIGDFILDLAPWLGDAQNLNIHMALPAAERADLRRDLSNALRDGSTERELIAQSDCEMLLPAAIGDYTDFYASIHHATNVGRMFRPDNPLLPNYKHVPMAYHGRASTIVPSGTAIRRPWGQLGEGRFGPSQELDYELELAAFLGPGNSMGAPIRMRDAEEHIAGVCLLNDWSARDIQRWEYQPLGPFLAKNFGTSISPWMITMEALAPFRVAPPHHEIPVLPYLASVNGDAGLDITLEVWLRSHDMTEAVRISRSFFREMYWTVPQMVAHHASNGCALQPGDLIASGTVSGPEKENRGCLLELTWRGAEPLTLPNGETRRFLADGDEVILRGSCNREGYTRIGLGECRGTVVAAHPNQD